MEIYVYRLLFINTYGTYSLFLALIAYTFWSSNYIDLIFLPYCLYAYVSLLSVSGVHRYLNVPSILQNKTQVIK